MGIKPKFCDLIISESCMLQCKMCKMWQSRDDRISPNIESWERFIDSFADFVGGQAQVQFVGGEPLFKNGTLGLIRQASRKGLSTTMTTNAYLIDEQMAQDIAESGLNTIVLSLESLDKQTHDFLRGVDGAQERVMRAIGLLHKFKSDSLKIHIVTTIMQPNLDGLLELAEWVEQNKAIAYMSFQALVQPFFTPPDEDWYMKEDFSFLWPKDASKVEDVLDGLINLKRRGHRITNPAAQFNVFKSYFRHPERFVKVAQCNLGYNSVSVNTAGKVFLCLSLDPIGDISDVQDIGKLWVSDRARKVRESIKRCQKNCKLMINCFFEEEGSGF